MSSTSTLQTLTARFGGALLVRPVAAGAIIGLSRQTTYNRISCKTFPLPLVATASGKMVRLSDIEAYLDSLVAIPPCAPTITPPARRGRPTKAEQIEAAQLGITVAELRKAGSAS